MDPWECGVVLLLRLVAPDLVDPVDYSGEDVRHLLVCLDAGFVLAVGAYVVHQVPRVDNLASLHAGLHLGECSVALPL